VDRCVARERGPWRAAPVDQFVALGDLPLVAAVPGGRGGGDDPDVDVSMEA